MPFICANLIFNVSKLYASNNLVNKLEEYVCFIDLYSKPTVKLDHLFIVEKLIFAKGDLLPSTISLHCASCVVQDHRNF